MYTRLSLILSLQGFLSLSLSIYISCDRCSRPYATAIMSDEGDRACPLCAEEMDLTDQQLKPCKCGYEICVWCWHHIMDMAEKDHSEGRCPACRTPYNKEKIVGTTAKCERLMAEVNIEKKAKSQRTKSKSDGRKQLGSVRVIQKSLVYIVGLPLTLADENLLHHRDYFGQYGRVMKVSISRTAAGSIQQFANNTCSVYITYSKEEEAVRCIQSVHGFILDGRPLRACFGTTKYCHAWLRNVPCNNPDCLYLHEIGTEEDSFSKDEIISAYTRNRVQQITGAPSNIQRRSGNVLPPPADESHISISTLTGKPTSKSASNNIVTSVNSSPPNGSSARSAALPSAASWGARASNGNPPSSNIACSNGSSKLKSEVASNGPETAVAATVQVSLLHADTKKLIDNEESHNKPHKGGQEPLKSSRQRCTDNNTAHEVPVHLHSSPSPKGKGGCNSTELVETISIQGNNDNLCSGFESMSITTVLGVDHSSNNGLNSSRSGKFADSTVNQEVKRYFPEELKEPSTLKSRGKTTVSSDDSWFSKGQSDLRPEFLTRQPETDSHLQTVISKSVSQFARPIAREHLESLEEKKLNDSEFVNGTSYFSAPSSLHHSNLSSVHSPKQIEPYGSNGFILDPPTLDNNNGDNGLLRHSSGISAVVNEYHGHIVNNQVDSDRNFEHACLKNNFVGRSEVENAEQSVATDMGESNIISNILSLDFDPWEESLTSPQNLVKLLGDGDKRQGPPAPSNSWKAQSSNKSRFSFARPDEYNDLPSRIEPSFSHMQQMFKESPLSHDFAVNRDFNSDKFGDCNGFSTFNTEEPDNLAGSYSYLSPNKFSGSRSQVSAPPGFSFPNKAPPPGFTSHERAGPNFDAVSGNNFLGASSLLRNTHQSPQTGNMGSSIDIEFMDPAILAIGKGRFPIGLNNGLGLDMRYDFSPQLNAVENEARFQSLMNRSSPPVQNMRFSGMGSGYGPISDTHNHLSSRIMEQNLISNTPAFSQLGLQQPRASMMPNGQWNSANDMGMAELLRTESLGFNKFYGGYEDSKFRMPGSGDIYNRTYGI